MTQLTSDDEARTRLALAQRLSDVNAKQDVALYVFEKWHWRLRKLFCSDPAIGADDLEQVFFQGIFEAVDDAALDRGDPLYFLSQRGVWRVTSMLSSSRLLKRGAERAEDRDRIAFVNGNSEDPAELVVRRVGAHEVALEIAAESEGSAMAVFEALFRMAADGEVVLKQAADEVGVSPQRVSQIVSRMRGD